MLGTESANRIVSMEPSELIARRANGMKLTAPTLNIHLAAGSRAKMLPIIPKAATAPSAMSSSVGNSEASASHSATRLVIVGKYNLPLVICKLLVLSRFFRKDPVFVPQVAPYAKEAGRNEKADVGRDADGFQAPNN